MPSSNVGNNASIKQWKQSLRSRSPSLTNRNKGNTQTNKSLDLGNFHKEMVKSVGSTKALEEEYIKSLQHQIYLLELENNYIRQQALKATQMHPEMMVEASKMLSKLKQLQTKIDSQELEIYRKDSNIDILKQKLNQLSDQIQQDSDVRLRERDNLVQENVQLREVKDNKIRDILRYEAQIEELKSDLNRRQASIEAADNQIANLRGQLEDECQRNRNLERIAAEKGTDLLKIESTLRQMEQAYRDSMARLEHESKRQLRQDVEDLRKQLQQSAVQAEQDRGMRDRLVEDNTRLSRENARTNEEVALLQTELEKLRTMKDRMELNHACEKGELNRLVDRERDLVYEAGILRRELEQERGRTAQLTDQTKRQERRYNEAMDRWLAGDSAHKLDSHQSQQQKEQEKHELDKQYLMDHIKQLQRQLVDQAAAIENLKNLRPTSSAIQPNKQANRFDAHIPTKDPTSAALVAEPSIEPVMKPPKSGPFGLSSTAISLLKAI